MDISQKGYWMCQNEINMLFLGDATFTHPSLDSLFLSARLVLTTNTEQARSLTRPGANHSNLFL